MNLFQHQTVRFLREGLTRRSFFRSVSAGALATGTLTFRDLLHLQADELQQQGKSLILLFMQGAPSQFETFDPKPHTEHGGPTEAIKTAVPGIDIAQGWEQTAKVMQEISLIRSMTNKEGNHPRAVYQLHTGYVPSGSIKHPSLNACVAKEIGDLSRELPTSVSIGRTIGSGFLGVDYDPFVVNDPGKLPQNVESGVESPRFERRLGLLGKLEEEFASRGAETAVANHKKLYEKTSKLVLSPDVKAFDISDEPSSLQARYGDTQFGRGCLLARRLVEAGVTCVEVTLNGWDTHDDNFTRVSKLAGEVDPALSTLVADLKDRGRLDSTLILWIGEFGRTPRINPRTGRDHYPRVFNAAIAGGGIRGGQVIGASSADGVSIERDPVTVADLFATMCKSLHIDPQTENLSPIGRPLKIVDGGKVIEPLFS